MRKTIILVCALCLSIMAYARSVSNVQAVLNESGDKVIITYQLDEKSKIEVYFSPTGLDEDYVRLEGCLTGAVGAGVSKGKKKTIEWNPSLSGYRSFVRDEVRFKVVAKAPTDNASELFSGFKPQKSDNASEHHEGESDIIPLVYVPQGDVPHYDIIVKPDSIANADSKVTLVINSKYNYAPSVDVKAILPDGHEVALDIAFEMLERKIRYEDGDTGKSRFETIRFKSRNPHIVLGQFCQDGITKLIVNIHDPRKVITITKEIRTLRVKQAFNTLPQSELVFSKQHEREKIEFNKIYRWEKLTKNFDRTKIIRGLRINNTKSSDNNLYFSRQSGINLNGKTSMECKEEAQGYAFYTMVNTGFKTADGKYTGIISYLPQHNYDQPFANGYDEWQGIGLNMPIVLQQKKDANNYEFYFVEDEVYWGGVEKSNLEIEGIEVYVYDKAATEAEYAKRLDAYNKQQEKIRKEREERAARDNMPKPGGDYVPGYHVDVPGQSSSQNISGTYYSDKFKTGQSVHIYLMSNSFKGDDGITIRVNSDLCVCANGTPITGAIQIVDYSSTKAVFTARNPHKGITMTFTVDASRGVLYYHEANAYYYKVR